MSVMILKCEKLFKCHALIKDITHSLLHRHILNCLIYFKKTVTVETFLQTTMDKPDEVTEDKACMADGNKVTENIDNNDQQGIKSSSDKDQNQPTLSKSARKRMLRMAKLKELKAQQKGFKKGKQKKKSNQCPDDCSDDNLRQTDYYFENGLRKVYPYYYTFSSYAKGRWVGREVLEVLSTEFKTSSKTEHENIIERGKLTVNGKPVSADYKLKLHDLVEHIIHRHENPVRDVPVDIIEETDSLLVVNKPASMPVHACGRYRFNSILFILAKEYGYTNLRNFYRLDRLTSGVLILGKTVARTTELHSQVMNKILQKEYVCRVEGEFPEGTTRCDQPLLPLNYTISLMRVSPEGKESSTTFTRLSYNGRSSVVKCVPHTGRTHQIRVHLQYLGHPIINDPFYNSEAFGPSKGKGGVIERSIPELMAQIIKEHNIGLWESGENPAYLEKLEDMNKETKEDHSENKELHACAHETVVSDVSISVKHRHDSDDHLQREALIDNIEPPVKRAKTETECESCTGNDNTQSEDDLEVDAVSSCSTKKPGLDPSKLVIDMECTMCKHTYKDPEPKEMVLFLHALCYKGPGWKFSAPLPDWAQEDWKEEDDRTNIT